MTMIATVSVVCFTAVLSFAQSTSGNSGTIRGSIPGPWGAAVADARRS